MSPPPRSSAPGNARPKAARARRSGLRAEETVESWLVTKGWFPLARNHVVRGGELDLVMRDGKTIVFVEVKQRKRDAIVGGLESMTPGKQRRLVRAAAHYLAAAGIDDEPVRFDVVTVTPGRGKEPEFQHLEAAFDGSAGDD